MPKIKFDHVVSFSSEDPVHVASNILLSEPTKKWKCQSTGEKSATIVLQLEKASIITGIDIGNEGSAYVEVFVTRSGTNEDYKQLLVMSSFMTPLEARQSTNINKVRIFNAEHLCKPECEQKWDRVKIVCMQPFNRHVQYGLSFVTLHTTDQQVTPSSALNTLGKFTLRPDSPDNQIISSTSIKKKEAKEDKPLTAAASIREASSSQTRLLQNNSPKLKIKKRTSLTNNIKLDDDSVCNENLSRPRNRNELLYDKDEEGPNEKIDKIIKKKDEEKQKLKELNAVQTPKKVAPSALKADTGSSSSKGKDNENNKTPGLNKRKIKDDLSSSSKKIKIKSTRKPFNQLLNNVVLVISGIQNPDRADLRSKALKMGAIYKADWDNTCTHLICAFPNTPKFNQVRGKGKIVTRKWIEDCYTQRKRFPWRRYCLDKNDKGKNESEDEIFEETDTNSTPSHSRTKNNDTDNTDTEDNEHREEGSDTEERIERILKKNRLKADISVQKDNDDPFSVETDSEELVQKNGDFHPKFLEFFNNKKFYIDPSFDRTVFNKLNKYIHAYKGTITDDPTDEDLCMFITTEDNVDNFKDINLNVHCVKPDYIVECHNQQQLIPEDDFLL